MTDQRNDVWTPGGAPEPREPYRTDVHPDPRAAAPSDVQSGRGTWDARPAGARSGRSGRKWWPWALLALLAVAALLFGLTRCGADRVDTPAAAPGAGAPNVPGAGMPEAGVPNAGAPDAALPGAGALTAGDTSLFDAVRRAGDRPLAALAGRTASGTRVPVQSVPADEGFWIGAGDTDRVWVQLSSNGESAVSIKEGDLLDLSGPVVTHGADFAGKAGVTAEEGAEQLTREGAHLEVDPNQVEVVGTR